MRSHCVWAGCADRNWRRPEYRPDCLRRTLRISYQEFGRTPSHSSGWRSDRYLERRRPSGIRQGSPHDGMLGVASKFALKIKIRVLDASYSKTVDCETIPSVSPGSLRRKSRQLYQLRYHTHFHLPISPVILSTSPNNTTITLSFFVRIHKLNCGKCLSVE